MSMLYRLFRYCYYKSTIVSLHSKCGGPCVPYMVLRTPAPRLWHTPFVLGWTTMLTGGLTFKRGTNNGDLYLVLVENQLKNRCRLASQKKPSTTNDGPVDQAQIITVCLYVYGRINETIEWRNLRQQTQWVGESFDDFLVSLQKLAKMCNFCNSDCLQKALRDQKLLLKVFKMVISSKNCCKWKISSLTKPSILWARGCKEITHRHPRFIRAQCGLDKTLWRWSQNLYWLWLPTPWWVGVERTLLHTKRHVVTVAR